MVAHREASDRAKLFRGFRASFIVRVRDEFVTTT
jgi:hypothetical protein